ncbi:glycosyl hydrolase family 2 [Paenibacillus sp. BK033]|uniref:hypothetical protein n=1 Tax=Paenibacillus sp. BK033 TaxID=2512133 RepID=UPI0010CE04F0|nr:hypothetical protein [Paenibacillus sp. BK033]TCM96422.1 glycosyl hydrolase family 2 [Paenibacillus sp. BK033]
MIARINLQGMWELQLDEEKVGLRKPLNDTIALPGTTSHARKGKRNQSVNVDCLTDEYAFEGWAWYSRKFFIPAGLAHAGVKLYLERTRVTTVWIDGEELGTQNSLCAPHLYELKKPLAEGSMSRFLVYGHSEQKEARLRLTVRKPFCGASMTA